MDTQTINSVKLELCLTAIGAVFSAAAAFTQLEKALSMNVTPAFKGVTAACALGALSALVSMIIGIRLHAIGFVLRIAAVFMVLVFGFYVYGLGLILSIIASFALIPSAFMLVLRDLKETESRGVSRM